MANIIFEYLYRDASNWKQYGQTVFTNIGKIPLADVEAQIRASLHDGEWFKAEEAVAVLDHRDGCIGCHKLPKSGITIVKLIIKSYFSTKMVAVKRDNYAF